MCPYNNPECDGISGLYFGRLSCFKCYCDASADAQDTLAEVMG